MRGVLSQSLFYMDILRECVGLDRVIKFYITESLHQVIALTVPFLATLADDLSELG